MEKLWLLLRMSCVSLVPQARPSFGLTWDRQQRRFEWESMARGRELEMFGGPARIFFCPEPALSLSKG
jgi:hypothetical protein